MDVVEDVKRASTLQRVLLFRMHPKVYVYPAVQFKTTVPEFRGARVKWGLRLMAVMLFCYFGLYLGMFQSYLLEAGARDGCAEQVSQRTHSHRQHKQNNSSSSRQQQQ